MNQIFGVIDINKQIIRSVFKIKMSRKIYEQVKYGWDDGGEIGKTINQF